jgi:hypothetical protein
VVTVLTSALGWRGGHDLAGGPEIAAVAASAPMEQGGRAGQDGMERGSPVCSDDGEVATGGGAEEVIGVGWAPVTDNVRGELPELEGRKVSERAPDRGGETRGGELTIEGKIDSDDGP